MTTMSRRCALAILAFVALAGKASASGHYIYIPIIIPINSQREEIWTVEKDTPYARWDAKSKATPGTIVTLNKNSEFVDTAPLHPEFLFATDQDLVAGDRIWLPKGGVLIKMAGDDGNWFCTWRYGDHANATSGEFDKNERELCLHSDGNDRSVEASRELTLFPAMLTILPSVRDTRLKGANPVVLRKVDPNLLPVRVDLHVVAQLSKSKSDVCLSIVIDSLHHKNSCFGGVGQTLSLAGGVYTLLSVESEGTYTVRIDNPADVVGIGPQMRRH